MHHSCVESIVEKDPKTKSQEPNIFIYRRFIQSWFLGFGSWFFMRLSITEGLRSRKILSCILFFNAITLPESLLILR